MSSSKASILKKTAQFGASTFLSRILGIIREIVQVRLLGVGLESDAFLAAFKIPNSLRKIFGEGALTGAFVPTIVSLLKRDGKKSVDDLMTTSFVMIEGMLLALCLLIFCAPYTTIKIVAFGFSPEKITYAAPLLRILISFILFVSSSALLGCALQAVNRFFVPAFFSVILNIFFIAGVLVCLKFGLSLDTLCWFIVGGSVAAFIMHVIAYFRCTFKFGSFTKESWKNFTSLINKILPSLFGMSILEINLLVDSTLSSFLATGSYTLLYYGARFMQIPFGVFGVALSSVLLPHFSRINLYAPRRLGFYVLEAAKLTLWLMVPVTIFMMLFSHEIFTTLLVSAKFPVERVPEASTILIASLVGLFFFVLNKTLINIFYSMHDMRVPTITSVAFTIANISASLVLMPFIRAAGLALATSIAGMVQTVGLLYFLKTKYGFKLYGAYFVDYLKRYALQLVLVMPLFWLAHRALVSLVAQHCPNMSTFFLAKFGFWLWTGPLIALTFLLLYATRKLFGLRTHFLD